MTTHYPNEVKPLQHTLAFIGFKSTVIDVISFIPWQEVDLSDLISSFLVFILS